MVCPKCKMDTDAKGSVCSNCGGRINMFSDNKKSGSLAYMESVIEQMEENERNNLYGSFEAEEDFKQEKCVENEERENDGLEASNSEQSFNSFSINSNQKFELDKQSIETSMNMQFGEQKNIENTYSNQKSFNGNTYTQLNQQGFNGNTYSQPNQQSFGMNGAYYNQQNINMQSFNPNFYQNNNYNNFAKNNKNHTLEFDRNDISENKIIAMLPYLLGVIGVIIALLAAKESRYVNFHVRQSLKFVVCNVLLTMILVPVIIISHVKYIGIIFFAMAILFGIVAVGLFVLRLIAFVQVCNGQAKEPIIVSSFESLK